MTEPSAPVIGLPRMSRRELALFRRMLDAGFRRYAEFGMGGSTLLAIRAAFERIVSIDTDNDWVEALRRHAEVAPAVASGRARLLHADIGRIGPWGNPAGRERIAQWPRVVGQMWAAWSELRVTPELILVDGRFRAACCLSVALMHRCAPEDATAPLLMIHDVSDKRPIYQEPFKYFDVVEAVETLYLLRPNRSGDPQAMLAELLELQFVPQ